MIPDKKICNRCGELKPLAEFGRDKAKPNGRGPRCYLCCRENQREYRIANPEALKKYRRKYSEAQKKYHKKFRLANPEYQKKKQREYMKKLMADPERREAYKKKSREYRRKKRSEKVALDK